MRSALLLGAIASTIGGCASRDTIARVPVRHVVIVDLGEPGDYREFGTDCFQLFTAPGVVNILTGPGLETGEGDALPCGAGVVVDMSTAEECRQLPAHPAYRSLMEKWRPRARSIRVVSFGPRCEEPAGSDAAR